MQRWALNVSFCREENMAFAVNGRIHWGVYKEHIEPNRRQCNGWLVYAGSGGDTATQEWSSQKLELKGCSERGWWEGSEGLLKINHKKKQKNIRPKMHCSNPIPARRVRERKWGGYKPAGLCNIPSLHLNKYTASSDSIVGHHFLGRTSL